jgi:TPR repeat protein
MRLLLAGLSAALIAGAADAQENPYTAAGRYAFLEADYATAKQYLEPLAEAGDAEAQYWVGVMYSHGRGYSPVCGEAARWYERAAKQGHPEATFSLGFTLYRGSGSAGDGCVILPDRARAAPWLKRAAEMGAPRARYMIGHMYRVGDGVAQSEDEALKWLEKAANAGLSEAQFDLGVMHASAGNNADAYFWFFMLALKGYPGAWHNAEVLEAQLNTDEIYEAVRRAHVWSPTEQ